MMPWRILLATVLGFTCGCSPWSVRSQSPEAIEAITRSEKLVGDYAVPFGTDTIKVESVALVTGLGNTGSDPAPSPERSILLSDMQTRGVEHPNRLLESSTTSLVLVRGFLRPGIQKGDRFDLEVRIPSQSETTSLRNGWLMPTRLKQMAVIGGQVHDGSVLALAEGPILIDPGAEADESGVSMSRGRILGGGVALESRKLQLVLRPEHRSVHVSGAIGMALDRRFHTYSNGIKNGVATPKTDEYIELDVHPRYKDNIQRYLQVVAAVAVGERPTDRVQRIQVLRRQLFDPVTASSAALRLEAIGKDGVPALRDALGSSNAEVRFFAAEALAYLDVADAAPVLAEAARKEPAFRVFALTALSAMQGFQPAEALQQLLHEASAETRYGAFRALWAMNANDPLVRGEKLGGQFSYHVLDTNGPPMVHVTRGFRAEVVLFGEEQRFATPLVLDAGRNIMVNSVGGEEVVVSAFVLGQPEQKRIVSPRVDDVVRAIVELGGTYPDVVEALQQAKASGSLASRFEVDALPQAGRSYTRQTPEQLAAAEQGEGQDLGVIQATHEEEITQSSESSELGDDFRSPNAVPELFGSTADSDDPVQSGPRKKVKRAEPKKKTNPLSRIFGKMKGESQD